MTKTRRWVLTALGSTMFAPLMASQARFEALGRRGLGRSMRSGRQLLLDEPSQ